jgi:hypothetical protein
MRFVRYFLLKCRNSYGANCPFQTSHRDRSPFFKQETGPNGGIKWPAVGHADAGTREHAPPMWRKMEGQVLYARERNVSAIFFSPRKMA